MSTHMLRLDGIFLPRQSETRIGVKMAGTREGGLKARDKLLAKNPDHYKEITARGGRKKVAKGFAMNPELAREAGKKSSKAKGDTNGTIQLG